MTIKKILSNLQERKTYSKRKLILEPKEKNLILSKILKKLTILPFNKIVFSSIKSTVKLHKSTMTLSSNRVQWQNHRDPVEFERTLGL